MFFSSLRANTQKLWRYIWPLTIKRGAVILVVVILLALVISRMGTSDTMEEAPAPAPVVSVGSVSSLGASDTLSFIGTVRAVSEARIQSETSGRVTSVSVKPGDIVQASAILGTLENRSQQAALLQAQGAYEAALASAAQSEVSVLDAENGLLNAQNNAINAYRNAYTTVNAIVLNDIDVFFSNPNAQTAPGLRILGSNNNTTFLNNNRTKLRETLTVWKTTSNTLAPNDTLSLNLSRARSYVEDVTVMVDILIQLTSTAKNDAVLDGNLVTSYTSNLTTARATLNATLSALTTAESALVSAAENLRRAQIGATQNNDASLANAQVKQALGVLRGAQANYEQTIFRAPIPGTVNNIRINVGDFVQAFSPIAEVANNEALQISIYVNEAESSQFVIGESVTINQSVTGTITSIATALDPITRKIEVRVSAESDELTNGSTVNVSRSPGSTTTYDGPLRVPLTAVKFTASDGSVFVVEDDILKALPVTLGSVSGSFVTITSGIDASTMFVLDARGLSDGQRVRIMQQ